MTKVNNDAGWYGKALKNWPKQAGAKPTAEMFKQAHLLGCRPGKQALARALELRPEGATDGQVKAACIAGWGGAGSQHNKRRDLVDAGLVKMVPTPASADGHKVYRIELTAKGSAKVKTAAATPAAAGDKPAKVTKPKKAKGATPRPATAAEAAKVAEVTGVSNVTPGNTPAA